MKNYIEVSGGHVGFGATREEALRDVLVNKCRFDINEDTTGEFISRRKELYPWLPKENMLHITGLGCLVYNKHKLTNVNAGKSIDVLQGGETAYYYLANLFGKQLSYTDITVCLRPELDQLFGNINKGITPITEMPYIKLSNRDNDFKPTTVYTTTEGVVIGVSDKEIGMKFIGDTMFHTVDLKSENMYVPILSYIGYKMNIIFTEEGIELNG